MPDRHPLTVDARGLLDLLARTGFGTLSSSSGVDGNLLCGSGPDGDPIGATSFINGQPYTAPTYLGSSVTMWLVERTIGQMREEIERCSMCDNPDDESGYAGGYLLSGVVCDHQPHNDTIKRGMAKVRAVLEGSLALSQPTNPLYEDLVDRQRRTGPPQDMPDEAGTKCSSNDAEPQL